MRRPRISISVDPPRDRRTAVTVGGIGLTEPEAITLINQITDQIETRSGLTDKDLDHA